MRVEKRESVRVFSTLMSWSNKNESCMRVEKRESVRVFSTLMSWSNKNESCMRVEKRSLYEFSQLSCLGQTRTRVA